MFKFLWMLSLLLSFSLQAQETVESTIEYVDIQEEETIVDGKPAPVLNLEILGKTPVIAGLSYEHYLKKNIGIGIGLGYANMNRGDTRQYIGSNQLELDYEDGTYFNAIMSAPIYLILKQGNGKHHIIEQLGVTTIFNYGHTKFPSGTNRSFEAVSIPLASVGYEYEGKRVVFRLPVYLGYLGNKSGIFPKFMPWGGVSIGIKLN